MSQHDSIRDEQPINGSGGTNTTECSRPSQTPPLVPDHDLLRRIGKGSYGEVWLARNMMGTFRAVKIVYRCSFKDLRPFERELSGIRKFEPVSRSHLGFIDILHIGMSEKGDYFYYVMELGDDCGTGIHVIPSEYCPKTLARFLTLQGKLGCNECLQLGLDLSQALSDLHRRGLVHRDVKPSNILFVNGTPKLADIGLVAATDETQSYVGTEGFIPPEGPGSPRADVYALGKVLYEAMTGRDRQDYPELPAEWDKSPDHDQILELNEVLIHACGTKETQRYQSAEEMHADLVVLLNGRSVRRLKTLERQMSRLKRVGAIVALLMCFVGSVCYMIYREVSTAAELKEGRIEANIAYGNRAMESGDLLAALPYFSSAMYLDRGNQSRAVQQQLRFGSSLAQSPKIVQMFFRSKEVDSIEFSPDGRRLLIMEYWGRAQIFDVNTGAPATPPFGQSSGLSRGAYSPDGNWVVTASEDNSACIWSAKDGTLVARLPHPRNVFSAAFSPDGRHVVTACMDSCAWVWDARYYTNEFRLKGHTNAVLFATYNHHGNIIATASEDFTATTWDAKDGHKLKSFLHPNWVQSVAFSSDDRSIVTGCDDHKARSWDLESGERISPSLAHRDVVGNVGVSPDGRFIFTGSLDGTVRLWSVEDRVPFQPCPVIWHNDRVTSVALNADGHRIATGCIDGTVRVWDLAGARGMPVPITGKFSADRTRFLETRGNDLFVLDTVSNVPVSPPIRPVGRVQTSELSDDGRYVLTVSGDLPGTAGSGKVLEVWNSNTGARIGPELPETNEFVNLRLSQNARRLLAFGPDFIETWDPERGKQLAQRFLPDTSLSSAILSPSGEVVVGWGRSEITVWTATNCEALFPPLRVPLPLKGVGLSSDGRSLVSFCADALYTKCSAQLWNMASGEPLGSPLPQGDGVLSAVFSPGGNRVATAGEDSKAMIWSAATKERLLSVLHESTILEVCFNGDGRWIATASADKTARVWSAETGDPLTPPLRHHSTVFGARFMADDRHLVTSDDQGHGWVWVLPRETRPVEDLLRLSRLLAGDRAAIAIASPSGHSESTKEIWKQLRTRYPAEFQVTDEDIASWHDFEAEESELHEQWPGALFHLEKLFRLRPSDKLIAQRLAQARAKAPD